MDRDTIITNHLREPGTCLRVVRIAGRGSIIASLVRRCEVIASGSGTSLSAALDGLAEALSGKVAA